AYYLTTCILNMIYRIPLEERVISMHVSILIYWHALESANMIRWMFRKHMVQTSGSREL
ncbi:uncharacterized protein EI90DRAFT_3082115, partial [Cantharellus anzutake]|uniref:uncharacterized protein n=1 Tax=Cantharellus anzutake TaxID=1750568 RepID=UPI001906406E